LESKQLSSKSQAEEGGFGGGFGGGSVGSKASSAKKFADQQRLNQANKPHNLTGLKPLWANKSSMSPLMRQVTKASEMKLKFERQQLLKGKSP
jgi:hypothetical protein